MHVSRLLLTSSGPHTLDQVLSQVLRPSMPWVLKMHTSGNELELLQGGQELLRSGGLHFAVLRMEPRLRLEDGGHRPPSDEWRRWLHTTGLAELYELRFSRQEAVLVARASPAATALLRRDLNFTR